MAPQLPPPDPRLHSIRWGEQRPAWRLDGRSGITMRITIECECGNKHILEVKKKYMQCRDNLEAGGFRYTASDTEIQDG